MIYYLYFMFLPIGMFILFFQKNNIAYIGYIG